MVRALLAVLSLCALPALGETAPSDGIAVDRLLTDEEFYRLATCGAPPGGDCRAEPLRWDKSQLTVTLSAGTDALPPDFLARLSAALRAAIVEVNGTGAGITLASSSLPDADIRVLPTRLTEGEALSDVPGFSGPGIMGIGYMTVWSDHTSTIREAVILISTEISPQDLRSVMLEEVTQALGFLYDIDGPAYEGVSILSQSSNATVTLTGQDARLLRRHYPPTP